MPLTSWICEVPGASPAEELALKFDHDREMRLLVLPALFDEAGKLRRQTVETMRILDRIGIDSLLPDLPGTNESLASQDRQTLPGWRAAAEAAARHFGATHMLSWRSGALLAPADLPGWRYAPVGGARLLRALLRARVIAAREAGREETLAGLQEAGRSEGIELAGWQLGPELFTALELAEVSPSAVQVDIRQEDISGTGLWLRAEAGVEPAQAEALAAIVARDAPDRAP